VECTHGLLDGGVGVEAVDPEEINVVCFQTLEGVIYCCEQRGTGEAFTMLDIVDGDFFFFFSRVVGREVRSEMG
jgi:hypothetical protein